MLYLLLFFLPIASILHCMEMEERKEPTEMQKVIAQRKAEHMQQLHEQNSFVEAFLMQDIRASLENVGFSDYKTPGKEHSWDIYKSSDFFRQLLNSVKGKLSTSTEFDFTTATDPRHMLTLLQHLNEEDIWKIQQYRFLLRLNSYRITKQMLHMSRSNTAETTPVDEEYKHLGSTHAEVRDQLNRYCLGIQFLKKGLYNADAQKIRDAHRVEYIAASQQPKTLKDFLDLLTHDFEEKIAQQDQEKYMPQQPSPSQEHISALLASTSNKSTVQKRDSKCIIA